MTRYITNDFNSLDCGARQPSYTQVKDAVIKRRGWYLYHENSLSARSANSVGRGRELICSADSGKIKGLIEFIKKS